MLVFASFEQLDTSFANLKVSPEFKNKISPVLWDTDQKSSSPLHLVTSFTNLENLIFRFPKAKDEGWFLVLGNVEDDQDLLALKRVPPLRSTRSSRQQVSFYTPEKKGRFILTLYLMSDAYLGLDQQYDIPLEVIKAKKPTKDY